MGEVRQHLRIDADDHTQDTWLLGRITAAREFVEERLNRQLLTATWLLTLDNFPQTSTYYGGVGLPDYYFSQWQGYETLIYFDRAPLQSLNWVKYISTQNVLTVLDPSQYLVDVTQEPGRMTPAYGIPWPIPLPVMGAVQIQFQCGYGDTADSVPARLKEAMLLMIGKWWKYREDTTDTQLYDLPSGAERLLTSESWGWYR